MLRFVCPMVSYCYANNLLINILPCCFCFECPQQCGNFNRLLSIWSLYDQVDPNQITKYSVLFGYSFFIFVFHEPLLTILIKGMFFLFGKTDASSLLIYIIAPLMAIGLSILLRYVLKKSIPRVYNFATGGR